MSEFKTKVLILMLMGIIILLMITIIGLFVRVNQLQTQVIRALQPFQVMKEHQGLEIGTKAPTFTLVDTKGRKVSLGDFAGNKILLIFSSIHCPACTKMYPHIKAFNQSHPDIQTIMVSLGTFEENRQLAEEQDFSFPILIWDDLVAKDYKVPGTPFFYVINEEGIIINPLSAL